MAEKNIVPNLETKIADGNPVFTPRQCLERFKQFTKREHKTDITPLPKGEKISDTGWAGKEQARRFHLGSGTGSTLPNNPSRIQDRSGQQKNQSPNPVIYRILFTETKHLPQPRRILLGETIRRGNTGRLLETTDRN